MRDGGTLRPPLQPRLAHRAGPAGDGGQRRGAVPLRHRAQGESGRPRAQRLSPARPQVGAAQPGHGEDSRWNGRFHRRERADPLPAHRDHQPVLQALHTRGGLMATSTSQMQTVRMSVFRGEGGQGEMVTYDVPIREGMVVLDAVLWVQANLAPDLAVRWNCKAAKCGSCSAEINGFPRLMCKSPVSDYGAELSVRPMRTFPVIRDLVTDVSWNYEVNKRIPQVPPSQDDAADPEPWRMQQEDVDRITEFRKCIECFLCQDVCHVLRNHDRKDAFFGPRFMIRTASL